LAGMGSDMLNGLDPIIIFNFSKLSAADQETLASIPIVSSIVEKIGLPPIPIYLSERLTGLYIDSEDKNIDIETSSETLTNGEAPQINQKGLNSTVTISLVASRNSIGLTLLAALADRIFKKVTSREYSITYLHGAVTVFNGLLNSFQISQNAENDLYNINIELFTTTVETQEPAGVPVVEKVTGAVPL
jgi:hypothetical protein